MKKITYDSYFDKVYGCFLGKMVFGTLGAPYEGIKMPMNLNFSRKMLDAMIPNDDLDLQILWLEVAEKLGPDFTSEDLLRAFCENCDYSPGEYAVMRKNFDKGILPPLSGSFCNDFYREGMGSPIRSEIWACLAPGNPELAAEYAHRDAVLDHSGSSVYGERFFSALESAAFFESDLDALVKIGLHYIPSDSRMYRLITDAVLWAKNCTTYKEALFKLLRKYGHNDCTNVFQNIGIILLALYFGDGDFIKANMLAVNSGFDTDCTCATIGAIMGTIYGAEQMIEKYDLQDVQFVLTVRANRRSSYGRDLAEDIALLGCAFAADGISPDVLIENAPKTQFSFAAPKPLTVSVRYDGLPTIALGGEKKLFVMLHNNSAAERAVQLSIVTKSNIQIVGLPPSLVIAPGKAAELMLTASLDGSEQVIYEKNLFCLKDGDDELYTFGLSGETPYVVYGPFWKTAPALTDEQTNSIDKDGYFPMLSKMAPKGNFVDFLRNFHVNFSLDEEEYLTCAEAGKPLRADDCRGQVVNIPEDSFSLNTLYEMQGPTMGYLVRKIVSDEDRTVCMQIGHTDPFRLYINEEMMLESKKYDAFTGENYHLENVSLKKGVNTLVVRFVKTTPSAKFSIIFSKEPTCAEHYTCFGSVNPYSAAF